MMNRPFSLLSSFQAICLVAASMAPAFAAEKPDQLESALALIEKDAASVHRFTLDNGMIGLVKEDRSAEVVSVQVWVKAGAINEGEYAGSGLAHFVEHMIFKGTPKRDSGAIWRDINNAGGEINAYTALDRMVIYADMPAEGWKVGLDVLSDTVMNAVFPEDEWQKEKEVVLREFAMGNDNPNRVIGELLWSTAYTRHPFKYPVIGIESVFRTMTRTELLNHFKRLYVPGNMMVVIVGAVDPAEAETLIRGTFAGFAGRPGAETVLSREPVQKSGRFVRKTGQYNVSRLEVGYHAVALDDDDAPALDVLAQVVGGGRSSRLVSDLKERRRLVHAIDAWSYSPAEPGLFGVSAQFDPDREKEVLDAIEGQVESWKKKDFTKEEVRKAARMLLSSELSGLQTAEGQADSYASGEFFARDPAFSAAYLRAIDRVTPGDLKRVAAKYLGKDNRTVALLTPETGISSNSATASAVMPGAVALERLPNGVRVLVREDHRLPFVYLAAVLRGGLLSETATNNGCTKLVSELLVRGTGKLSTDDIALQVESMGATLSPFSGMNSYGLRGMCLTPDLDAFASLFAQCVLKPSFLQTEVEKQKALQVAEIERNLEQPMFIAQENLRASIYVNHPYRWNATGTRESVGGLTRDDAVLFHSAMVAGDDLVVAVFGDITASNAFALVRNHFAQVESGHAMLPAASHGEPALPCRVEKRLPREQTIYLAGFPGVDLKDPRSDALAVLDKAMDGIGSELGSAVREREGLAYYVGTFQQVGLDPGMFAVYAGTREDQLAQVEGLIGQELRRVTVAGITAEERDRAVSQILAGQERQSQDNLSLAMGCALDELYGLGYDYSLRAKERFAAVTVEQVRAAAASIISTNHCATSIVLPLAPPAGK